MKNSMETDAQRREHFKLTLERSLAETTYIVFSVSVLEQNRAKLIEQGFKLTKNKSRYYRLTFKEL